MYTVPRPAGGLAAGQARAVTVLVVTMSLFPRMGVNECIGYVCLLSVDIERHLMYFIIHLFFEYPIKSSISCSGVVKNNILPLWTSSAHCLVAGTVCGGKDRSFLSFLIACLHAHLALRTPSRPFLLGFISLVSVGVFVLVLCLALRDASSVGVVCWPGNNLSSMYCLRN